MQDFIYRLTNLYYILDFILSDGIPGMTQVSALHCMSGHFIDGFNGGIVLILV